MNKKPDSLEDAVIDLYINVKIRDPEEVEKFNDEMFEKERKKLKKIDPFKIIDEIKVCFEAIMNMNQESDKSVGSAKSCSRMNFAKVKDCPISQEEIVQKLESEIRSHIRLEQQMKIHIDDSISKCDKLKRKKNFAAEELKVLNNKKSKKENDEMKIKIDTLEKELAKINSEIKRKDERLSTIENQLKEAHEAHEAQQLKLKSTKIKNEDLNKPDPPQLKVFQQINSNITKEEKNIPCNDYAELYGNYQKKISYSNYSENSKIMKQVASSYFRKYPKLNGSKMKMITKHHQSRGGASFKNNSSFSNKYFKSKSFYAKSLNSVNSEEDIFGDHSKLRLNENNTNVVKMKSNMNKPFMTSNQLKSPDLINGKIQRNLNTNISLDYKPFNDLMVKSISDSSKGKSINGIFNTFNTSASKKKNKSNDSNSLRNKFHELKEDLRRSKSSVINKNKLMNIKKR